MICSFILFFWGMIEEVGAAGSLSTSSRHFLLIEVEDLIVRSHVNLEAKVSHKDLQKRSFSEFSVLYSVHSSGASLMSDGLFKYSTVGGRKVGIRRNTSQVDRPTRH
ncbi:uncharacterized protein K444DRAFT_106227 [Hyaloscypha bicolor E]|uniref:Uncharacterized protein n=1 Tax=Hyaloscypha bicolor E TaxID=1095630 RepID=A0A2J6SUT1_9HELO|nr:uncharacterized protein K444DRAFT_106227 [Hyaloscypha bicolor E]PMD54531.1 hypothetical protein K444DRAFT_106227 [Hyaloscypha bicolor E]